MENGLSSSTQGTQVVANDIIVAPGDEFTLDYIEVTFISSPIIVEGDIIYYEDDNGLPGNVLNTMTDVIPTSVAYNGTFGVDSFEVKFDLPPFSFASQGGEATRYWISIAMLNDVGNAEVYWETKSKGQQGLQPAIYDGSEWMLVDTSGGQHLESVYIFSGECLLSASDATMPTISLFPNPVTDALSCINCEPVTKAVVYDLSGKRVVSFNDVSEEINLENLQLGMYFVELSGSNFRRTFRIIKE